MSFPICSWTDGARNKRADAKNKNTHGIYIKRRQTAAPAYGIFFQWGDGRAAVAANFGGVFIGPRYEAAIAHRCVAFVDIADTRRIYLWFSGGRRLRITGVWGGGRESGKLMALYRFPSLLSTAGGVALRKPAPIYGDLIIVILIQGVY